MPVVSRLDGRCRLRLRPRAVEESPGSMETGWRLTAAGGDPRDSATENKPPAGLRPGAVRVKRCGKSAPRVLVTGAARQTPPGARPNRGGRVRGNPARRRVFTPVTRVGCLRRSAMGVPDEWPFATEPGLQAGWQFLSCHGLRCTVAIVLFYFVIPLIRRIASTKGRYGR